MVGNKIELNGKMVLDLSEDNTIESDVRIGKRFHKANGEPAVGTAESFNEGGSGEQPTLYAPSIALDNYKAMLTIDDAVNGKHTEQYRIYYGGKYVGSTEDATVNLLSMTDFTGNDDIKVVASASQFNDSAEAVVTWEQPKLKTPTLFMDDLASTLTILDYDHDNTNKFNIYVDGELVVSTLDTSVQLLDYLPAPTSIRTVTVVATSEKSYYQDSMPANANWKSITTGTEGLTYSIDTVNMSASCTGLGTATETDIVIASWYEGYPVTSIADSAFYVHGDKGNGITSIVLPEGIERVEYRAFYNSRSLKSIRIPSTLKYIGQYAFGLATVEKVYISDLTAWCTMEWVYNSSASQDPPIRGENITMYLNNRVLSELVIPEGITVIPPFRFFNVASITSAHITDGVTEICDNAFMHCTSLVTANIPKTVTNMHEDSYSGSWIFAGCSALRDVVFAASVKYIPDNTFWSCGSLRRLALSKTVTDAYQNAFLHSGELTNFYYEGTAEEYEAIAQRLRLPIGDNCTMYYNVNLDNFTFPEIA